MTIQFAGRALASGQFAGRALASIYKGSTKLWPATAPQGPMRIDSTVRASGPSLGSLGYNYSLPALADIKAGDLITLLIQRSNASSQTIVDDKLNDWITDYNNVASSNNAAYVYHAVAAADAASLVVSVSAGSNSAGIASAAAYRAPSGTSWNFDATNSGVTAGSFSGAALSRTFSTSGPGVVLVGCNSANFDNNATYGTKAACTGATIESECPPNATAGTGYFGFFADFLTADVLADYTVTGGIYTTTPGDTASRKDLFVAPFIYS